MKTITEEMVNSFWLRRYEFETKEGIRAALEAVAPMLIAQGLLTDKELIERLRCCKCPPHQCSRKGTEDADTACDMHEAADRLEAIAPMLIAQGMREADTMIGNWRGGSVREIRDTILARAQELDPK